MNTLSAISSLKDGDIFLYHGNKWISKAIRYVDGTEVNHASIFVGDNHVIEATSGGVKKNTIEHSKENSSWIKIYRLKERPSDMSPVIARANWYYGQPNRYGFEQILLLAFLCIIRKSKKGNAFRSIAKTVLERAAALLLKMTEAGKEVLICSELVYRSYDEAYEGIDDPYSLRMTNLNTTKSMFGLPANVHPESLYALFSFPAAKSLSNTHKADIAYKTIKEMSNMDIESLADLDIEMEKLVPLLENDQADEKSIPEVTIEELEGTFLAFAGEVHNQVVMNAPERKESRANAILFREKSMTFQSLNDVIADFVTPGDLYKADALTYIDTIK
ncbi:MAG: hypothetical protein KN64_01335 [Sulfurovum sp. AS07-7]|nr:MAG: hypothetical protein KN64_01335 [Sulfurovum sp. AS07-7]